MGGALRKAELQVAQLQLDMRFRQNLELFRVAVPELYERIFDHTPTSLVLHFAEGGYVDLTNRRQGDTPVYGSDPRVSAQAQVDRYRARPRHVLLRPVMTVVMDEANNLHVHNANQAVDILQADPADDVRELPPVTEFMLMLGLGLGHHLELLLAASDIRHMCIVEPELDVFHASLHTIDWAPVLEHFAQMGRSLKLIIDPDPASGSNEVSGYMHAIGSFHAVRPFIYEHASSPALVEVKRLFIEQVLPAHANQVGYFDDERVGLAHSLQNYENGVPLLQDHVVLNQARVDTPAFVVANGPSLDKAIDFLKVNRERAIVFSCGTALGSLRKAGIRPDFHVEMERSRPVLEWIQGATDPVDREGITLLALNTVHPEVFGLFERFGMAMKANDSGTRFLSRYLGPDSSVINLTNSNPTVGNCALAFASALGFSEVYLFGLDLGFPAAEKHHSALSLHYDIGERHIGTLGLTSHDDEHNFTGPGNFGGEVVTTRVYKWASQAAQKVIAATPGLRCFNTSHGLHIPGAQPLAIEDIVLRGGACDRTDLVDQLYRRYFGRKGLRRSHTEHGRKVFMRAGDLLQTLAAIAATPVRSRDEGMAVLQELHSCMAAAERHSTLRHSAILLKGSVSFFSLILAQALQQFGDVDRSVALYDRCRARFTIFLDGASTAVRSDPLAADMRTRDLAAMMRPDTSGGVRAQSPLPS